jgi:transcriptional regulator with XRE-family HTH domain
MNALGQRIIELRKKNNLSQTELAKQVGLSYAQIGRYETKGAQPPAEVLKKIADVLGSTADYLIYGNTEEKAQATLKDSELLQQFKALEQLDEKDKNTIKDIIDAFIKRSKLNQIAAL